MEVIEVAAVVAEASEIEVAVEAVAEASVTEVDAVAVVAPLVEVAVAAGVSVLALKLLLSHTIASQAFTSCVERMTPF